MLQILGQGRIEGVEVALVQAILHEFQALGEPLIVNDFALTQVAQNVFHVRVVGQMQKVFVGSAGLLLCCNRGKTTFGDMNYLTVKAGRPKNSNIFRWELPWYRECAFQPQCGQSALPPYPG